MAKKKDLPPKSIDVNGYAFQYLEQGEGPLVMALHGFPDNPYTFRYQMEALADAGYRVVAPYKRGFTPGDTTVSPVQHSSLYTQDVLALIDAFGKERVILIGHDWGAGAAYGVAKVAPEKVKAIITIAIPLSPRFFTAFTTNLQQIKRSWYNYFFQQPTAKEAFEHDDYAMLDLFFRDWSPDWKEYKKHLKSVKETYKKEGSVQTAIDYYRQSWGVYELKDEALKKLQKKISDQNPFQVPCLYFHGKNDGCIGVENADGMEQLFAATFEKHIIKEAGHFAHLEKPEVINKTILKFLKSL